MKTAKQKELIHSYLSTFEDEVSSLYQEIIMYLSELGYHPKKEKSTIAFKHNLHNKQIAKMGTKTNKNKESFPFFSLRFSACYGYSQRFANIVSAYIVKYPTRIACCINAGCDYCRGEAHTHVYSYLFPDGENKSHCGAYAIEIPDITVDDIGEIKKLMKEEHEYLLQYEVD